MTLTVQDAKFMRSRLAPNVIARPAVIKRMQEALSYPLTVIRAGAGYGKTTLINQAFPESRVATVWLHLSEQDVSPFVFLRHLVQAVACRFPDVGLHSMVALTWENRPSEPDLAEAIRYFIQELKTAVRDELLIILDDYQKTGDAPDIVKCIAILTELLPPNIHLVVSTREKLSLPEMAVKQAKAEVLEITQEELAFKQEETRELFCTAYGVHIDREFAGILVQRTEGWAMALCMLAQLMRKGFSGPDALAALPRSLAGLFEFLAQTYLRCQPEFIRCFLGRTSHLKLLKADDCDRILGISSSADILSSLENKGLFTFRVGQGIYRYHQLFQEFLQTSGMLSAEEIQRIHWSAASYYRRNDPELALEHYLDGGFFAEAAEVIREIYASRLAAGRHDGLARWLDRLPENVIAGFPELLLCRGDICRYEGDFAAALEFYSAAEKGFAKAKDNRGQYLAAKAFALLHLDTVQPALAEKYLAKALGLCGTAAPEERARLYQLMAENQVNLGRAEQANFYFRQANEIYLEESRGDVEARLLLRTGRLTAAKAILLRRARRQAPWHIPKSHRETPLLLSLINSFMGEVDEALENARKGLNIGERLNAVFVQAIGYMRLGHAYQLRSGAEADEAEKYYRKAMEITATLGVERCKAEALWGLCLLYGHSGSLEKAVYYGLEGLRVTQEVKDEWMAVLLELALAIAYWQNGVIAKAQDWLKQARSGAIRCGDSYLAAVAALWLAQIALKTEDYEQFHLHADALFAAVQIHGFDCLLSRPTLLGLRDVKAAAPLLLAAKREKIREEVVGALVTELGLPSALMEHPGYTIRVQTLGPFAVWRGIEEVKPREWQREKARRLFQYLLTKRSHLVSKEQIIEDLWYGKGTENDFKVAMNAMANVLEPNRPGRRNCCYIVKHDSHYSLNLAAGIIVDADEFETTIVRANRIMDKDPEQAIRLFRVALNMYKGDFLQECSYEDWCLEERERLLVLYLTTAEKMATLLIERGETEEAASLCLRILAKDRCWEKAYCLLMQCYYQQQNRAMIMKVFRQCQENLRAELGIPPSGETMALFKQLTGQMNTG